MVEWKVNSEEEFEPIAEEGIKALDSLSITIGRDLNNQINSHFLLKPLIKLFDEEDDETYYTVPFPSILGSTVQFRVENYIQNSKKLKKVEEKSKGNIVEFLANKIFASFPNKNIIKNFKYKLDKRSYESDIVLFLKDSIWVVEVKSHPIFRKIPLDISRIIPIFINKVREGLNQGLRTLDYLNNQKELLFNVGYGKELKNLIKGVIVVLDGFIPVLLSQNEGYDEILGTSTIYRKISNSTRIYVTTILDLYILSTQPDKEGFENFLLWRTNHLGSFPIVSYDEREYWAFFNDLYNKNKDVRDAFQKSVENKLTIYYISARFNKKEYLEKLTKQNKN